MSVERHALEAAIEYAKKLEQALEWEEKKTRILRYERGQLQICLNRVRDAARDRMSVPCEASMPMAPEATDKYCLPPQGQPFTNECSPSPKKSPY